jgi:iron-sulfur cluster assembly accessory protein
MSEVVQYEGGIKEAPVLTEAANLHIEKCLAKYPENTSVRLSVKKTGCSGMAYVVDFVPAPEADDFLFPQASGLMLCIAKSSYPYLKGLQMDYQKQGLNSKFVFKNPNQTGECGCGESFTIK